jgi:3-oxoacyl-[acyl-carrier-protein] synthase III
MALGIRAVATYIPPGRLDLKVHAQASAEFLEKKIGFQKLARKAETEHASDLAFHAFSALQKKADIDPAKIGLITVVTQNPDQRIPHVSATLHARLGLPETCATFDISQGCAGYVMGLATTLGFLREHGLTQALLFTSDPYSEIVDPNDRDTALLFGDGASATWITDQPQWTCGAFSFYSDGSSRAAIALVNRHLTMDGGGVVNFAARQVPREIEKTLAKNQLRVDQVDAFLLHSGSRYIVETIAQRAHLPLDRCPLPPRDIGNTVSTSLPLLLETQEQAKTLLLCGFGVGLSAATTVLRRP